MLTDKLRDGAHGKVFKIIFWIIILSFIFAGVGNYLIPRLNTDPVEIGDIKISANQWNSSYQDQVRAMQNQYGPSIHDMLENPEAVKVLRMQVLERLIDNAALASETYKQGIRIGDEQVKDAIRKEKAFFKDGKFNNDVFLATVKNMGSSPDYFAQQMRASLAQETIAEPVLRSASTVYPYEVELLAKLFAQSRVVDLYSINIKDIRDTINLSDDEIKKFYDEHHDKFMAPATVKFNYVVLSVNDLKKQVKVDEGKLEEYFNLNQTDFTIPEKRECSQILIKSSTADFEKKANEALAMLNEGKSFESVGEKFSDDADFKKTHGSLGSLEKGNLSSQLDIALFSLEKVGSYSKVIVDNAGAHIIRLDGITKERIPALADVKDQVKEKFIDAQALDLYTQKSATFTDLAYENPDSLDLAAEKAEVKVQQSGAVAFGDESLPWPLNTREVQKVAFDENVRTSNQNSNIIQLGNDACAFINVTEYKDASLKKFEDVAAEVKTVAADAIAFDKAQEKLEAIKTAVSKNETPATDGVVKLNANQTIARGDAAYDPKFIYDVFSVVNKENSGVISSNKGNPTLIVLKSVKTEGDAEIEKYSQFIRAQLVQFKVEKANSMIHMGARELSDIKYNEDAIKLVNSQNSSAD
ncbi:SurA N-terminal domain-containing protein [uncultured Succinivibrio sp.]|uniref:SurA N-terminal domain-containing protein n=2 Tax=uncultured Succinivibrio sp. TaxID=540749 RepID=UPI0025F04CB3|nr:SurA N-terminal domain-containing protein [uncultured Succinivibrio sp.]